MNRPNAVECDSQDVYASKVFLTLSVGTTRADHLEDAVFCPSSNPVHVEFIYERYFPPRISQEQVPMILTEKTLLTPGGLLVRS